VRPRAERDDALITLACAHSVDDAARGALDEMLDWLGELRPLLAREDAHMLLSIAADVRVTQLVNGTSRGAHVVLQKNALPPLPSPPGSLAKRPRQA
jgi:acetamidase/formamidase